jgi:zinc transporter
MSESMQGTDKGLICAYRLDGTGGGTPLDWSDLEGPPAPGALTWIHLDLLDPGTAAFVRERSGLEESAADILLAEHTRPRVVFFGDALAIILRGINFNPGSEPDDMVSIRIWASKDCLISCRRLRLGAVDDVRRSIAKGRGPSTSSRLLAMIADRLVERMDDVIEGLEDQADMLEEQLDRGQPKQLNAALADLRRSFIGIRRYLIPQRDALMRLAAAKVAWMQEDDRSWLREVADQTTRLLESLEAAREQSAVTQDELLQRLSERTERRMYLLSVITAIFLPLGLFTGLLGVNVGGIPGTENPWAFALLCTGAVAFVVFELWFLRSKDWF